MMTPGKLWTDSLGQHPYAKASWIGQARWRIHDPHTIYLDDQGEPDICPPIQVLALSVPPSVQWHGGEDRPPRAVASFLPWKDTGIGIVTLTSGDEAVVAVMDVAGQANAQELRRAGMERRVAAAACTEHDLLEWCPMQSLLGVPEALAEAATCRRLAATELVEAVETVRRIVRSPAVFPMLGLPPRTLKSLTLNVCEPL